MSLPRQVLTGSFYLITRRCTQREYLLKPDAFVNNAFVYCLAVAAALAGIDIIHACAMSNHHHTVIYDRTGMFPKFIEHFHKLLAKTINAYRGRWENVWTSQKCSVVRLLDHSDIIEKIVYTLTNPVSAHLVERAVDWPGVNTHRRERIHATRPDKFFRKNGSRLPDEITLELTIPPELGPADQIRREIDARVAEVENRLMRERKSTLRHVLGATAVLREDPNTRPATREPRRGIHPNIAARDRYTRIDGLVGYADFLVRYREALALWSAKRVAVFPRGTYHLRQRYNVDVDGTPPTPPRATPPEPAYRPTR
jgi:REP element-mobilizing transposase RayT